jgi:hypothetical protein
MEKYAFEKSWLRSVDESKRLRDFLSEELYPYRKNIEWQSTEAAQCQITSMIRPMLEAIRNILRNILLYDINSSIKLSASCIERPAMICYTYDRTLERIGEFWILSDYLHPLSNMVSIENTLKSFFFGIHLIYLSKNLFHKFPVIEFFSGTARNSVIRKDDINTL